MCIRDRCWVCLVCVWAGTARYPLVKFVPVVLLGKTIKITMISLAGYFGLEALMNLVG